MAVNFLDEILVKLNGTSSSKKYLQLNGGGGSGSVSGQAGVGFRPIGAGSNVHASIEALENGNASYQANMTFNTNGSNSDSAPSERMRITYDGNIGIGTTSPGFKLDVAGNARASYFALRSNESAPAETAFIYRPATGILGFGTASAERMRIDSSGKLGIGTTAPATKLDILDTVDETAIRVTNNNYNNYLIQKRRTDNSQILGIKEFGSNGGLSLTTADSRRLNITNSGDVGIGTSSPGAKFHVSGGAIRIDDSQQLQFGNGNVKINNDSSGRMYLKAPLAYYFEGNGGYKMVLDGNSGNLGIGTTSPGEKLEVAGKVKITGTANFIDTTRNASSQANYIRFYDSSTSSVEAYLAFTSNNRDFKINSANGSGTITLQAGGGTAMHVDSSQNVGIGTTSPSQKLTVAGTIMSTATSNPTLILQDSTHSDITIKGDSGIFSVSNQSVGQNITMLYNGNVGIGTTSPTSKLHVNGLLQAEGINSLYIGTLTTGSSTGWYRAMEWTGSSRGGSVICLSTTGGSWGPVTYVIKAYKTYGNPAAANTLKLEQYGLNAYITEARITYDSEASKAFVEVYKNVTGSMPLSMFQDKLIGYDATSTVLTGTASTGGGSVLEQLKFVPEGTTMEKLLISDSIAVGGITNSTTAGRIDASNDVVAYSTSDIRLKDNIKTIDKALDKVNKIQGIEFDWIEKEEVHGNSGHDIGVIAQEIEKILPDVVTTRDNGYKAVKYEKIVPLLIEAIKDLSKQVDGLKRLI